MNNKRIVDKRKLVIDTANYWYHNAHNEKALWPARLLYMENALNHTESALVDARKHVKALIGAIERIKDACSKDIRSQAGGFTAEYLETIRKADAAIQEAGK